MFFEIFRKCLLQNLSYLIALKMYHVIVIEWTFVTWVLNQLNCHIYYDEISIQIFSHSLALYTFYQNDTFKRTWTTTKKKTV